MNIDLIKIEKTENEKLERLMQLYLHELSAYFPVDFNSKTCLYEYELDKYFKDNHAYLIKENENILGFILVDINEEYYEISETFILNNYKKTKELEK